jgi:hypothetical protein
MQTAPIACSLEPSAIPERLSEFENILAKTRRRLVVEGGLRLEFDPTIDLGALAKLLTAEQQCCPFWSFSVTIDDRGIALEVRGPEGTADILDALFGVAA